MIAITLIIPKIEICKIKEGNFFNHKISKNSNMGVFNKKLNQKQNQKLKLELKWKRITSSQTKL